MCTWVYFVNVCMQDEIQAWNGKFTAIKEFGEVMLCYICT